MMKTNNETSESVEKILDGICDTIQKNKKSISDINSDVHSISIYVKLVPEEVPIISISKDYIANYDNNGKEAPIISISKDYIVKRNSDGKEVIDLFNVGLER